MCGEETYFWITVQTLGSRWKKRPPIRPFLRVARTLFRRCLSCCNGSAMATLRSACMHTKLARHVFFGSVSLWFLCSSHSNYPSWCPFPMRLICSSSSLILCSLIATCALSVSISFFCSSSRLRSFLDSNWPVRLLTGVEPDGKINFDSLLLTPGLLTHFLCTCSNLVIFGLLLSKPDCCCDVLAAGIGGVRRTLEVAAASLSAAAIWKQMIRLAMAQLMHCTAELTVLLYDSAPRGRWSMRALCLSSVLMSMGLQTRVRPLTFSEKVTRLTSALTYSRASSPPTGRQTSCRCSCQRPRSRSQRACTQLAWKCGSASRTWATSAGETRSGLRSIPRLRFWRVFYSKNVAHNRAFVAKTALWCQNRL